jgi:threonine/homoserine/homoserine lactone efflux protein
MAALVVQVVFYGLAAAVAAPVAAVVTALILGKSTRPVPSAIVFTAGAAALDALVAVVFLWALGGSFNSGGDAGAYVDVALGAIFAGLGIKAIFSKDSPDADAARRARAEQIARARLLTLFAAGVAVQVVNADALAVFLGGVKEVAEANVSSGQAAIAVLIGLTFMLIPYYGPLVLFLASPARASARLAQMIEWMMGHSRALEIWIGLAFGVIFLAKGIGGLT